MKQKHADTAVALLVGAILLSGGFATLWTYRQWDALGGMGDHMGMSVRAMHGTHPVWYLLGTILVAGVIVALYVSVRASLESSSAHPADAEVTRIESDTESPRGAADSLAPPMTETQSTRQVLDLLPDDERRILQPVLESPGLTQIELRDRSDFSKSKVSQSVTDLEKRGLLYRMPQGRTYRVYPADDLEQLHSRSPPED